MRRFAIMTDQVAGRYSPVYVDAAGALRYVSNNSTVAPGYRQVRIFDDGLPDPAAIPPAGTNGDIEIEIKVQP